MENGASKCMEISAPACVWVVCYADATQVTLPTYTWQKVPATWYSAPMSWNSSDVGQCDVPCMPCASRLDFCTEGGCEGLARHFVGMCEHVSAVSIRRADRVLATSTWRAQERGAVVKETCANFRLDDANDSCSPKKAAIDDDDDGVTSTRASDSDADDDWRAPEAKKLLPDEVKEVQKLEKKLRDIAKIEVRMDAGERVDSLQVKKVAQKDALSQRMARIKSDNHLFRRKGHRFDSAVEKRA